jgi:hypothetical protein
MATFVKYECFVEDLAEKVHNLGSDALKLALTNTAPVVASHVKLSNITEISAGNGYSAGGTAPGITSSSETSGTYKLVLADVVFTASVGNIGPFRYVVLYNSVGDNSTSQSPNGGVGALIGYYDYGSSITLAPGETFTVDFDPSAGVLTLA